MSEFKYPEWQKPYQQALQVDEGKLKEKIHLAEWKVFQRLQQVSADEDRHGERQAIQDALNASRSLKRDVLHYPDWNQV